MYYIGVIFFSRNSKAHFEASLWRGSGIIPEILRPCVPTWTLWKRYWRLWS
jgi:hypothetical protein